MNWLMGLAASLALAFAVKKIPDLLASEESKLLSSFLESHDPEDDELLLAMVKWADKKIPGSDHGHLKYQAVANLVTARFPLIGAERLDELIEQSVDKLKAAAEQRLPPTA